MIVNALLPAVLSVAVFFVVVMVSLQDSVENWNRYRHQARSETYASIITSIYASQGELGESALQDALSPLLDGGSYLLVADTQRQPVWVYIRGQRVIPPEGQSPTQVLAAQGIKGTALPRVLLNGAEVVGYLYSGIGGFLDDPANVQFFTHILRSLFWGGGIGLVSAFAIGMFRSTGFSRSLGRLSRVLQEGDLNAPDLEHLRVPTREIDELVSSVVSLRRRLNREKELRKHWNQNIAHDLRTPLTVFRAQIEGILDGVLTLDQDRGTRLLTQLEHIESLVQNLRNLTAAEDPDTAVQMDWYEAGEVLEHLPGVEEKLTITISPKTLRIYGDLHLLRRGAANLIQNALDNSTSGRAELLIHQAGTGTHRLLKITAKNPGSVESENDSPKEGPEITRGRFRGFGIPILHAIAQRHGGSFTMAQQGSEVVSELVIPQPAA